MNGSCAVHFDVQAITTCRRCGRFCCEPCLAGVDLCHECHQRGVRDVPPIEGRATFAMVGLISSSVLMLGSIAADFVEKSDRLTTGALVLVLTLLALGLSLPATAIALCLWTHRAARQALARGAPLDVDTPAGAVVAWFIPILNLARPFTLMRQMFASAGRDASLVSVWQTSWLVGLIVTYVGERLDETLSITGYVSALGTLLIVVAGLVGARVVRTLRWPP